MRIGAFLDSAGTPRQMVDRIRRAVALGFANVWVNQTPGGWEPLTVLAAAGQQPVEVGTAVAVTYPQHPVVLAERALTTQALTGGRLTLGIGPSHEWAITGRLGIPYTRPAAHTREYLEILRPLLRGEAVSHRGELLAAQAQLALDAPAPSVLVSALGPRMLEVAADLADGTIATWVRPDVVEGYLRPRIGDGRLVVTVLVAVTDDPDGARERVAEQFAMVGDMPAYRAALDRGGLRGPADTLVAGDEEVVRREIARFADAGTTDFIVCPFGEVERTLEFTATLSAGAGAV